jgi:hypothetical protein
MVGTPVPEAKPFFSELRKDCFYILMLPADQREEFLKALDHLDLSEGPEILVLDEMHLTVMEFSKADRQSKIIEVGKANK